MQTVSVNDKIFTPYISAVEIQQANERLSKALTLDYADKKPLFIAILNGSFMFASDLFKLINFPAEICFIKLASYQGTKSTGNVITSIGLDIELHNRHVVLLEDIIDTGKTLHSFLPQFMHMQPLSLKVCVLLHKPECTVNPVTIDYLGFSIPDRFVVGYGLDFDGYGRNLPEIYQLAD